MEEIVPEIVGMFEADADAKQTGRHALFALPPASSIDRRLHAAQTRRANDELQGFDESIGGARSCCTVGAVRCSV